MNCKEYIFLLDEYLNYELEDKLHNSITAHLANCSECQNELEQLKVEENFYSQIDSFKNIEIGNNWDKLSARLIEESILETPVDKSLEQVKDNKNRLFFFNYINSFENLFLGGKTVFGVLTLLFIGLISLLIIQNVPSSNQNEIATLPSDKKELLELPKVKQKEANDQDKIIDQEKGINILKRNSKKPEKIYSDVLPAKVKPKTEVTIRTATKTSVQTKQKSERIQKIDAKPMKISLSEDSSKRTNPIVQYQTYEPKTQLNDQELLQYLNNVNSFLVTLRNIKNDEAIETIIGKSYQMKARSLLNNNIRFMKDSYKDKNMPTVELLKEIEPVLSAISKSDKENKDNKLNDLVKETGIVTKMRLWISIAQFNTGK